MWRACVGGVSNGEPCLRQEEEEEEGVRGEEQKLIAS